MTSSSAVDEMYYDYTYNVFLARILISHLPSMEDRQKVLRWINKLSTSNGSVEELELRNDFLYYLVLNIQNRELRCPFNRSPPIGPLTALTQLLPGGVEAIAQNRHNTLLSTTLGGNTAALQTILNANNANTVAGPVRSEFREEVPVPGQFLVGRSAPCCGALCYLAVCSKDDDW